MSDPTELLRAAFERHEHLTPDPAQVRANARRIARAHARRRTAVAVGGTTAAGGLVAALVVSPGALPSPFGTGTGGGVSVAGPAAGPSSESLAASPTSSPTVSPTETSTATPPATSTGAATGATIPPYISQENWDAFWKAGYTYDDAVALAKVWKMDPNDVTAVKNEAGRRLRAGERLPIAPQPGNVTAAVEAADVDAFFAAGYTADEADALATLWKLPDAAAAKIEGGRRLLASQTLPVQPRPGASASYAAMMLENSRMMAFLDAGYTLDDAVTLAKLWKLPDAAAAKIEGGRRLLAGESLPIKP